VLIYNIFSNRTVPLHVFQLNSVNNQNKAFTPSSTNFDTFKATFLPNSAIKFTEDPTKTGVSDLKKSITGVIVIYSSSIDDGLFLVEVPVVASGPKVIDFKIIGSNNLTGKDSSLQRLAICNSNADQSSPSHSNFNMKISRIKDIVVSKNYLQILVANGADQSTLAINVIAD
jgi:hypothetical protein